MPVSPPVRLAAMRAQIAALEAGTRTPTSILAFGDSRIDDCLAGGGLPLGRWHELVGEGLEIETAIAPAAVAALMARPLAAKGAALWVFRRGDLHAPGLQGLGFAAQALIQVQARDDAEALAVMEDALGTQGVSAVLGEVDAIDLTAGRRLQLACEKRGGTGFLIRRRPYGSMAGRTTQEGGSAAASRWRIAPAPSRSPDEALGLLGPPCWRVELERSRGGRPGAWILEQDESHGPHALRVVADLAGGDLAAAEPVRRAG
ncbi:protein ImuA [Caulobacter ginsengisoli]|uniref:Protein ImuA n=1 Tax=Caulobacter ginsengisoli TaxID=400775 RepID=A0ABU0IZ56_9CAUL|nr:protein imuA [Caulobacter ginsengisoli]MDQ0466468.1 protein ImuA [Caulobacter ginsengisoli]